MTAIDSGNGAIGGQIPVEYGVQDRSVWQKCPFLKLIAKVWNAVKKFFIKIKNFFEPKPFNLSEKDIAFLNAAKQSVHPTTSPPLSPQLNLRDRSIEIITDPTHVNLDEADEQTETHIENPDFQAFHDVGLQFIDLALESTYEEVIDPVVPVIQEHLGKLQEYLKATADVVITVGSRLSSPLEEKLEKFKVKEEIVGDLKHLMKWLLKEKGSIDPNAFGKQVREKIGARVKVENLDIHIAQCQYWLFETEQESPLLDPSLEIRNQSVLELVIKEAITILAERKIKEFDEKVKVQLNGHLPHIIRQMVQENGHHIGDIALRRLIALIQHVPFQETFDQVLGLVVNQTAAVIEAEKAKEKQIKEEKARLSKCDKAQNSGILKDSVQEANRQAFIQIGNQIKEQSERLWIDTVGAQAKKDAIENEKKYLEECRLAKEQQPSVIPDEEQLRQEKIQYLIDANAIGITKHLKKVGLEAESQAKEDASVKLKQQDQEVLAKVRELWLTTRGEEAAKQAYRSFAVEGTPLCHPHIDELELVAEDIEMPAKVLHFLQAFTSPVAADSKKHLFDSSAEKIIDLLFPAVKVEDSDGKMHEVDGILFLLGQLQYPDELINIFHEAAYIYQEVLTDGTRGMISQAIDSVYSTVERVVLNFSRNQMKQGIGKALSALFQKFIVTEKVNEMMAYDALPTLQNTLIEGISRQVLSNNLSTFSPLFLALVGANEESKETAKTEVTVKLQAKVSENLKSYQITDENLKPLITKLIDEIDCVLNEFMKTRNEEEGENKELIIRTALTKYFETQYHGNNPLYGDLVVNGAFKIGNLSSTAETFSGWFKDAIAKEITAATHEMRSSPDYLIRKATEQLQNRYTDKGSIKDLLYGKSHFIPSDETNTHLMVELENTARIAHDLVICTTNKQNYLTKKAIQWVIGSDHSNLHDVISRIYQKMFSETLFTQNLAVRFQEIASTALQQGAKSLNSASESQPIPKVSRIPSLIPDFVYATV
jgi:hypothetical protein